MRALGSLLILFIPNLALAGVVFTEDFEESSIAALTSRWDSAGNSQRMSFVSDKPAASTGTQSLRISGGSANLYRRILPASGNGYDQLYFRYYIKFDPACTEVHHGTAAGGYNPPSPWPNPNGSSGQRPTGTNEFTTGVEPMGTKWAWDFYTYWMHMRADGNGDFWGNDFSIPVGATKSPYPVPKGTWIALEFMMKMNVPVTSFNGEQAFWVDGVKKNHLGLGFPTGVWNGGRFQPSPSGSPFEGFQWRTTTDLALNYFWLQHYVDTDPNCTAWFDDLVVSTDYIGPIGGGPSDTIPPNAPTGLKVK